MRRITLLFATTAMMAVVLITGAGLAQAQETVCDPEASFFPLGCPPPGYTDTLIGTLPSGTVLTPEETLAQFPCDGSYLFSGEDVYCRSATTPPPPPPPPPPPDPVDACPDIPGDQPAGTDCTPPPPPPPTDACPDIPGDQPEGTNCTPPPPPPTDACPDIPGDQPAGTDCTPPPPPPPDPVDACPDIPGDQAEGTNCTPPPDNGGGGGSDIPPPIDDIIGNDNPPSGPPEFNGRRLREGELDLSDLPIPRPIEDLGDEQVPEQVPSLRFDLREVHRQTPEEERVLQEQAEIHRRQALEAVARWQTQLDELRAKERQAEQIRRIERGELPFDLDEIAPAQGGGPGRMDPGLRGPEDTAG